MSQVTKEDASDLQSHVNRVVECELAQQRAQFALEEAKRQLASFIHYMQYPQQKVPKAVA